MNDMFRIRYEGRGDNENIVGVMTHFSDTYEEAIKYARMWLDQVYGKGSEFDLFNAGPTFKR